MCFLSLVSDRSLAVHRKSVVEDSTAVKQAPNYHTPSPTHSHSQHTSHAHTNTTPAPSLMRPAQSSQPKGVAPNGSDGPSPRPKRKAPAPPTNHAPHGEHSNSLPRRSKNLRSSREDLIGDYHSQTLPTRDSDRRDRAHTQPQNSLTAAHRGKSSSHSHVPQNHIGTAQHQGHRDRSQTVAAHPSPSPPSSSNTSPKKSQSRRSSENHNASRGQNTSPSISSPSHPSSQHSQVRPAPCGIILPSLSFLFPSLPPSLSLCSSHSLFFSLLPFYTVHCTFPAASLYSFLSPFILLFPISLPPPLSSSFLLLSPLSSSPHTPDSPGQSR